MSSEASESCPSERARDDHAGSSSASKDDLGSLSTASLLQRKVNHIHKLERKHSSGDLHSRLKTRKLLGVGETDDGDVHRSKLSQILGHSEQLYTRFPRGLRLWQFTLAAFFTALSAWALMFPRSLYRIAVTEDDDEAINLPVRLYGTAMISFSVLFWSTLRTVDKDLIRWSLLSSILYFMMQTVVICITLLQLGVFMDKAFAVLMHRVLFGLVSGYYYYCVTEHKPPRAWKSNSMQDLSSTPSK